MKKYLSVLSILIVIFVSACASPSGPQVKPYPENELIIKENSPVLTVITAFTGMYDSGEYSGAEEYASALIADAGFPFPCGTFRIEPGELRGFTGSVAGFEKGILFGPADESIPFVGYVFQAADAQQAEALAYTLAGLADRSFAAETEVKFCGSMVCFARGPSSW